ncbi:hypothetical protein QQS21_011967 [Conoideocrella luteorostrata]|uniref:DUF7580 domain-containing protein n=1 Tax=Conoideocrella luteorostrata TaxID=1105319 RepID=A0AAJ0CD56_9HYPO|nr:hypothetical protein QQS21_011967 [Conoideocrella luteorostrata]
MWDLVLLGQVIPAFGALARAAIECETLGDDLRKDAEDCYSDIVNIGQAIYMSRGEWAFSLRDEVVARLLDALDTRLPSRWNPFTLTTTSFSVTSAEHSERVRYSKLNDLSNSIASSGLGGFDECLGLPIQPSERQKEYLSLVGREIPLFHKSERQSKKKRNKFLERIKDASRHLLDVYCRDRSGADTQEFSLPQHPSNSIKGRANAVCSLLERHWNCQCHQRAAWRSATREVRVSLIRHQRLAPKVPLSDEKARSCHSSKFEFLFPVCKNIVEWKVTNIEIKKTRSQTAARVDRQVVNNDICRWLLESEGFRVDFLAENDALWHLSPELLESTISQYTTMECLNQLLGDGLAVSDMAKYTPSERLILCYILVNSMLFFYPSSWFQTAWNSDNIYFVRRADSSTLSILTFPYLSIKLQKSQKIQQPTRHHMQYHSHPAILSLGIVLLEIATGARFVRRSREPTGWRQWNSDGQQALQQLQDLEKQSERDRSKRISPAIKKAICSCLMLKPPPDFSSKSLTGEGPIRHYILSSIVQPLALELRDGHKVCLEELDVALMPEMSAENDSAVCYRKKEESSNQQPSSTANSFSVTKSDSKQQGITIPDGRDDPNRYNEYTVAIICALNFEMSAVRYMLDREHGRLLPPGDPNMYVLGELSGHCVVLACLPGNQGKGAAAVVATNIARTFPSIKWRLLVGIGGGVPSDRHDIHLGDVVISMPEGEHGGVVQYDLGKDTEEGFQRKGFLCPPPTILRSAVGMMKSDHLKADNKVEEFLSHMVRKFHRLNIYARPSAGPDILFEPEYPHVLVKCAMKRDQAVQALGDILCFEMEAAGIAAEFSCIVIRGIADYADSHKNDVWHQYAAAAAAACAKELLSYLNAEKKPPFTSGPGSPSGSGTGPVARPASTGAQQGGSW